MSDTCSNVVPQGLEVESPLVAKRVVHTLTANTHPSEQVIGRGTFKAAVAENLYGLSEGGFSIKFFGPRHTTKLRISGPICPVRTATTAAGITNSRSLKCGYLLSNTSASIRQADRHYLPSL